MERTEFVEAAEEGDLTKVQELAQVIGEDGIREGLIKAAQEGHLDVVQYLLELYVVEQCEIDVNGKLCKGKTALMYAVSRGNFDLVRYLVEECSADVNIKDADGNTALLLAAKQSNWDVVRYLVEAGSVDVNTKNKNGKTALMYTCRAGKIDMVQYLVEECRADVHIKSIDGNTALLLAAKESSLDVVQYLIDTRSLNVNTKNDFGKTPLLYAASSGNIDLVRYLIDECIADVNVKDFEGNTTLLLAAKESSLDVVRYLFGTGRVNVGTKNDKGKTALMYASRKGKIDLVRYLVEECSADVNVKDINGNTALLLAAKWRSLDVVQYLVDTGRVNVNTKNKNGSTALMYAAWSGNIALVRYLVEECNADVSVKDNHGDAALLLAASEGHWDVVRYLVDTGSMDVHTMNGDGKTALMYAASSDNIDLVRYLFEQCRADVNVKDNDGDTALICSATNSSTEIVRYLVEQCNANVNVTNNRGQTALRVAADRGYHDIQGILTGLILPTQLPNQRTQFQRGDDSIGNRGAPGIHDKHSWSIPPSELELTVFSRDKNMGGDFRAKWLDAEVVAKLFVTDAAHSSFEDEVHLWQKLRHPNVIKLYGACDAGSLLRFFVCEYASKGSLQASSSVVERGIWKYLYEAALGLEFLHERGIVHGDLRCSNILIGGDDLAKLSNFGRSGLMKKSNEDELNGVVVGSLRWQAPEVLDKNSPTYASDVYALGMCILEARTGKVPWSIFDEHLAKKSKQEWCPENDSVWFYEPGILSGKVENLVWRMCCHDPHQRASLSSVVYELERLAARESINYRQPYHEPASSFDEYKCGELKEVWVKLETYMGMCDDDKYRRIFNGINRIYDGVRDPLHHLSLLDRFYALLTDFYQMIKMTPTQAHIMRLSSTRATSTSLYSLQWRIDALLASLGEATEVSEVEAGWDQQCDEQVQEDFVSGVADTYLLLKDLKSPEERSAFLNRLKTEMNNPRGKYAPDQLAVIQKAYDDFSSKLEKEGDLSELVPEWFIPWYELIVDEWNCLGTGGFGSVLRAKWLDSEVVVKRVLLPGSHGNDDQFASDASQLSLWMSTRADPTNPQVEDNTAKRADALAMFRREVDIWFGFSHPHVVRLFGACHVGRPFFVCEYATNGTLVSYLKTNPGQLWSKVYEAALGVQYLHARKVVHGDLKGNNIVVGSDMKAKVTDFGLSSLADNESTMQVSGAWHWVAPECLSAGKTRPTSASDIYSLGMCIVEALRVVEAVKTGSRTLPCLPWGNQDNHVVKYHATRGTLPSRPANCDDNQWELVTRMCALNPEKRIKISTVVDELAAFVTDTKTNNQDENLANTGTKAARIVPVEIKSVPTMIAAVKILLARLRDDPSQRDELLSLCASLWDRLEIVRGRIDTFGERCRTAFCSVVADANACTIKLEEPNTSLVLFVETTMRWYALHRRLDKFCDKYFIVCEAPCWEWSVVNEQTIPNVDAVEVGSKGGGCGSIVEFSEDALQTPEEREQVSCGCTCTAM